MTETTANRLASFVQGNADTRKQLEDIIGGLSINQLGLQMEDSDWTIAAALAHLAFWDRVHVIQLAGWERSHQEPGHLTDSDDANYAALPQWLALPPSVAAHQAFDAAHEVDEVIAKLPGWLVEAIEASGRMHFVSRVGHRREHIDQIELTLRNCGC